MFGNDSEEINGIMWNWSNFKSTEGFPVSENLLDWVIGQDKALEECYLCLDEWTHKLKWINEEEWYKSWGDPNSEKPPPKRFIPAGPYLFLLGDAGTGKSLIGRALSTHLTELYKKYKIKLKDVICWQNKLIPSEPKISCHDAGEGKKIVRKEKLIHQKKTRLKRIGIKLAMYFMTIVAALFISIGLFWLWQSWNDWFINNPFPYGAGCPQDTPLMEWMMSHFVSYGTLCFIPAGMILLFLIIWVLLGRFGGMSGGAKGISGSEQTEAPKILVDNSQKIAPFVDATGHRSAQLFGSIAWDPLQTGGLGTPEHQRTTAGDVHKANLGILYIDEIKNLHPAEAVTLLTVLEEGQLPITLRARFSAGGTSAMAVSTEPVPCLTFLVGAGNFDSIPQIHPALMDRITGYGKIVRMNNDMPNNIINRRRYIQFIAQEIQRFHLMPFSREACEEIINESRRKSGKRNRLSTKFRPLISIIKTSATLAMNEKLKVVERRHVVEAINEHCKTIQKQLLEHQISERGELLEIEAEGAKLGSIYGLAVTRDKFSGEMTGSVLPVRGTIENKKKIARQTKDKSTEAYLSVTGVAKKDKAIWINDSIEKVRTVILQRYGVDIGQHYFAHIDFAQSYGVDGPSAGVTMTLLLCSLLEGKPIDQTVVVTGDINIGVDDEIKVTAVGGVHEKIRAAEAFGFKKVIIPKKNLEKSINPKDYKIKIVGASTLDGYLKECLVDDLDG